MELLNPMMNCYWNCYGTINIFWLHSEKTLCRRYFYIEKYWSHLQVKSFPTTPSKKDQICQLHCNLWSWKKSTIPKVKTKLLNISNKSDVQLWCACMILFRTVEDTFHNNENVKNNMEHFFVKQIYSVLHFYLKNP